MKAVENVKNFFQFWYFQYLIHSGIEPLEPWERGIFNFFLLAFIGTTTYTTYMFMPGHLFMLKHFFEQLILGQDSSDAGGGPGIVQDDSSFI